MAEEHDDLSLMALTWLSNKVTGKGMRGETEVCLAEGYVADVVALCSLRYRYWQLYSRDSSIPTLRSYKQHQLNCVVNRSINYLACIFEAKVTRNDFLSTFNQTEKHLNRHQSIGNLHWCVAAKGIAKANELPDFWGLLEPCGPGLTERKRPIMKTTTMADLDKIAHALLWPIKSARKYIICEICGNHTRRGYCLRCRGNDKKDLKGK